MLNFLITITIGATKTYIHAKMQMHALIDCFDDSIIFSIIQHILYIRTASVNQSKVH